MNNARLKRHQDFEFCVLESGADPELEFGVATIHNWTLKKKPEVSFLCEKFLNAICEVLRPS